MKLKKICALSMTVFILIFGCTIPVGLATQASQPVPTALRITPVTPASLATQTPAQVPPTPAEALQSLRTSGPYLAYRDQVGSRSILKLLDADGQGQSSTYLPANFDASANSLPLSNTLSPDGKWLAFYTGSAGTAFGAAGPDGSDLTLNLMSIPDGVVQVITPLLSKDYPDIFTQAAAQLGQPDVNADTLRNAFILGITQSLDWSPDGRYMAFAGQMDGLSSDLYLYDSVSGSIQRLSSGPEEVQWISWSPDGKWILDGSAYSAGEGMQYNNYATSVNGVTINKLSSGASQILTPGDWLDDHTYFDSNGANGPGSYDLKIVDVNTGSTSRIWQGSYAEYAFVPDGNWVVLNANTPSWPWPYSNTDFPTGIFLVNTDKLNQIRVNSLGPWGCCSPSQFFNLGHNPEHLFLVKDRDSQAIQYLSSDGKLIPTGVQADRISVSPDRLEWVAIAADLQVYSDNGSLIRTVELPASLDPKGIGSIIWRQDSSGLFFTYHALIDQSPTLQLYYLDLAKGSAVQVGTLSSSVPDKYFWVSGIR